MKRVKTEIVVIGAGPGGYAAAFYAADMGKKVVLVDKGENLGGVCLNRGCIPSKALLHATKPLRDAKKSAARGIDYGTPKIDLKQLASWKTGILSTLSKGVGGLAKKRKVTVMNGKGHFEGSNVLRVETESGQQFIDFEHAIVAVGSRPALPAAFDLGNPRIMTSTGALELEDIPKKLLVVGGGYIGMELGTVYASLGSDVVLAEAMDSILAGADADLARPVMAYAKANFSDVRLGVKVKKMATAGKQIKVQTEVAGKVVEELYDRVLVSVGRVPNSEDMGLDNTSVKLDNKGYIEVNDAQQSSDPSIYAIGDIAGGILLAHKASREARVAVDAILGGSPIPMSEVLIPAVVFTDPEVAWVGLTEGEAKAQGKKVKVAKFPWGASGRALSMDTSGVTKLIVDPETDRLLGVGLVGPGAGDLISEAVVAMEAGLTVKDLALSVHPHPTLSETLMEAAELYYGHCTHS